MSYVIVRGIMLLTTSAKSSSAQHGGLTDMDFV